MKKRIISLVLTMALLCSLFSSVILAQEPTELYIHLGDTQLVDNGRVLEDVQLPKGMSFTYAAARDTYVLTLDNVKLTQGLSIASNADRERNRVEIVLKGSNVIDLRESDLTDRSAIHMWHTDTTIRGSAGDSLTIYGMENRGLDIGDGTLTIDGAKIVTENDYVENMETASGISGGGDLVVTGGADLDIWAGWIGIIVSGDVRFEDCTVNTNRIHVHSHVEEHPDGTKTTDSRTMTVGDGAVVTITSETGNDDGALMLLDGSTLKIDGGVLNCDFQQGFSGRVDVGFDEDFAINTVWVNRGEMNVTQDPAMWNRAFGLSNGRLRVTGGRLNVTGAGEAVEIRNNGDFRLAGGAVSFTDCNSGISVSGTRDGDAISVTGGTLTGQLKEQGLWIEEGRAVISGGTVTLHAGSEEHDYAQGIGVEGRLVVSGGKLDVKARGIALAALIGGDVTLLGGEVDLTSQNHIGFVVEGMANLRGGAMRLQGRNLAYAEMQGFGRLLYLGANLFITTSGAVYETDMDPDYGFYRLADGEPCQELDFGTSGGSFAGTVDVESTDCSVGVPFVVSADLVLGEPSGTAVFTLPAGLRIKGQVSVNGVAVDSSYDSTTRKLTVPVDVAHAALRFYAVAERPLDGAAITCRVTAGRQTHELFCDGISAVGFRLQLPNSVSAPWLTLKGSAAPDGKLLVWETSDGQAPVLWTEQAIAVDALGQFDQTIAIPPLPAGETTHTYTLKVELTDDSGASIDAQTYRVNYTAHATALQTLRIQNDYHGTSLDEILTNDILVDYEADTVSIDGSTATKAYNYFPQCPTFRFAARFADTSHIISAGITVKGKRGQTEEVSLRYDPDTGCFAAAHDFPDWAPVSFAVFWVEEGVVNRTSVHQAASDAARVLAAEPTSYEALLEQAIDRVDEQVDAYLDRVEAVLVSENRTDYYDADGELIYWELVEELPYEVGMELTDGFEAVGTGGLFVRENHDTATYTAQLTMVEKLPENPRVTRYTLTLATMDVSEEMTRSMAWVSPRRAPVFIVKFIPLYGDAIESIDLKLLRDSLTDFNTEFTDDWIELNRLILTTQTYRCPYTGEEIDMGLSEEAQQLLWELQQLNGDYTEQYEKQKDQIRGDMRATLFRGLSAGTKKLKLEKLGKAVELVDKGWGLYDETVAIKGFFDKLCVDPDGAMQDLTNYATSPDMLFYILKKTHPAGDVGDTLVDIAERLKNGDGTFEDGHEFMSDYRNKLTDIRDRYTELLRKEIDGDGEDCRPPTDDTPPLPGTAGGEEIPIPAVEDPSGYVYEAVTSNRLSGVRTTLYYGGAQEEAPIGNADALKLEPWDAAAYRQANPLTTDALGQYQWMVPDGWWQVKYEKEGYETVYSDWLPVPPPQTEVNVGMVSLTQPTVTAETDEAGTILVFDRYMKTDSIQSALTVDGAAAYSRLLPLDLTLAPDGETRLASRFLVICRPWELFWQTGGQLVITQAETYGGVELEKPLTKTISLASNYPVGADWDGNTCTLWLQEELQAHMTVLAAAYDNGRMTSCIVLTTEQAHLTGDTVKLFLLDQASHAPLEEAITLIAP